VEAFQRMVERADVFQDISSVGNSSMLNILSQSGLESFKKVLPTHSQMQDEDEDMDEAPHFGKGREDLSEELGKVLGGPPKKPQAPVLDELDSAMSLPA